MRNAYRACAVSYNKQGKGGKAIHAYRLIEDYNIRLPQTIQFDAEIDQDGILRLDLRTARISERSAAHYRRHRDRTSEGKYPAPEP